MQIEGKTVGDRSSFVRFLTRKPGKETGVLSKILALELEIYEETRFLRLILNRPEIYPLENV